MLRINKQGFTLIELMVVIVIIGVLASLAIPRFTEASAKAKVAEAPRVLASYESAYLAAVAEMSADQLSSLTANDLIFETPGDSKWFTYAVGATANDCQATAKSAMGSFKAQDWLKTAYRAATDTEKDGFDHTAKDVSAAKKMVPNFDAK